MSGVAKAASQIGGRTADPYRVLFDQLAAAAARCRLIVEGGRVVGAEVIDSNRAFESMRAALPQLLVVLSRARDAGVPVTLALRGDAGALSVSAYPVGRDPVDEALVVIEDVTAREQLEQSSQQSQHRFEQAFHGNAAAMVIAHPGDLRIIDVNPRWLELFGATRDEVIGHSAADLGLIAESTARDRIAQHEEFDAGYDTELELRTRAGDKLTVIASARPIEIAEGTCTLTTLLDITARKQAEEAFAVAFSASPAGMLLVDDASDEVVAINDRLLEMMQGRRDELVGRRVADLHMIASPPRETLLFGLAQHRRLDGVEVELARKTGPRIWALASTEMVTLHERTRRLSVFTDITARKHVERRLVTQNAIARCLAESSAFVVAMPQVLEALCRGEGWDCGAVWLASGGDAMPQCCGAWCDPDLTGDAATLARSIALLPGGLPGRVLATGSTEKALLDPACGAWAAALIAVGMRRAVGIPILRGSVVLGVVALAARDGGDALDAGERGLFDSVGHLLGSFAERTRAEDSLRELNAELEHRVAERTLALETTNRDLDSFSSSVSHDLRAPLRAILGFSEILLCDFVTELPAEAQRLLHRIHAGGGRLHRLVEDLLAFARLGRSELQRSPIDLDSLVRSVIDDMLAARELGDRVELRLHPLGVCRADPSLLRTVWTNLIDNALKYSQHREHIMIEVGREVRGDEVIYYVRDNGVGFDMANARRLFGVFQRLHAGPEFEGTGIGLANVRRIVERHHGRVAASSEPGRGSRFEFTLGDPPP